MRNPADAGPYLNVSQAGPPHVAVGHSALHALRPLDELGFFVVSLRGRAPSASSWMPHFVYNLEFPSWTQELAICGYRFYRTTEYKARCANLHRLTSIHSEFYTPAHSGTHAHTAYVDVPATEAGSILRPGTKATALDDILLLLSLFTCREVFATPEPVEGVIIADSRESPLGGILRCSIPYRRADSPADSLADSPGDAGFAEGIDRIYKLICTENWQRTYGSGDFLRLAQMAFRQSLPQAFFQSWILWESLYGLLHRSLLTEKELRKVHAKKKIQYLLQTYGLHPCPEQVLPRVAALADIRNDMAHAGQLPQSQADWEATYFFVQLTEVLIALILGLTPSNVMNTTERTAEYFKI